MREAGVVLLQRGAQAALKAGHTAEAREGAQEHEEERRALHVRFALSLGPGPDGPILSN